MDRIKSIRNSNKEFALNYYISINKNVVEGIVNRNIENIELEKSFTGNKKIDIFCKCKDYNNDIFIETQITQSDTKHLEYVKELVDNVRSGSVVIWIAHSFSEQHIDKLIRFMKTKDNIELYTVVVNHQLLNTLNSIAEGHVLNIIKEVNELKDEEQSLKLLYKFGKSENLHKVINLKKLREREYINKTIINKLRKMSLYLNVFKEKKNLDTNVLKFGGGRHGIDFIIVHNNSRGESFVGCRFTHINKKIFESILSEGKILEEKLGTKVVFDNRNLTIKLFYEYGMYVQTKIDWLVEYMDKLIFHLVEYTFYYNSTLWHKI